MDFVNLVIISFLAGAATGLGGIVGVLFKPGRKLLVLGLGFSSGVMLGIVFLTLIPEALIGGSGLCFASFVSGVISIFLIDILLPHIHAVESSESLLQTGILVFLGMLLHDFPEGLAMGAGYSMAPKLGIALALVIGLHNIPEGIVVALPLYASGISRLKSVLASFGAGLPSLFGACLAFFLGKSFPGQFIYISSAFAAGAMFYIIIDELIPEAHKYELPHLTTLGIMIGTIAAFIISRI